MRPFAEQCGFTETCRSGNEVSRQANAAFNCSTSRGRGTCSRRRRGMYNLVRSNCEAIIA
jgi:hypothetical protein